MKLKDLEQIKLSRSQWNFLIDEWIFKKHYREIFKDKFLDGLTYGEIADKHKIEERNAQKIIQFCLKKLDKNIKRQ